LSICNKTLPQETNRETNDTPQKPDDTVLAAEVAQ
jgi:hypothetical protein